MISRLGMIILPLPAPANSAGVLLVWFFLDLGSFAEHILRPAGGYVHPRHSFQRLVLARVIAGVHELDDLPLQFFIEGKGASFDMHLLSE